MAIYKFSVVNGAAILQKDENAAITLSGNRTSIGEIDVENNFFTIKVPSHSLELKYKKYDDDEQENQFILNDDNITENTLEYICKTVCSTVFLKEGSDSTTLGDVIDSINPVDSIRNGKWSIFKFNSLVFIYAKDIDGNLYKLNIPIA